MSNTPESILDQWMDALNQGDLDQLIGLYDDDAVLLPTFSNKLLCGTNNIIGYFNKLATYKQLSISLHKNTLKIQNVSDSISVLSGVYLWNFEIDGEAMNFEARFTYTIDLNKSRPIINHHSSQLPRSL